MPAVRSFLAYFADGHAVSLAVVFALFTCVIALCGHLGTAEVALREAAAPPTSSFLPLTFGSSSFLSRKGKERCGTARTTTVSVIALTAADIEALNGGPLTKVEQAAPAAVVLRRWRRYFVVSDVNVVRLPPLLAWQSAVLSKWFAHLEASCSGCHYEFFEDSQEKPANTSVAEGGKREAEKEAQQIQWKPFCSDFKSGARNDAAVLVSTSTIATATAVMTGNRNGFEEKGCDADIAIDLALVKRILPPTTSDRFADLSESCGLFVVLTPNALRSYKYEFRGKNQNQQRAAAGVDFESMLQRTATEVHAVNASSTSTISVLSSSFDEKKSSRAKSDDARAVLSAELGLDSVVQLSLERGFRPSFVLVAAWCSSARTYVFRGGTSENNFLAQPTLYVLCVEGNEVIDVNAAIQRFSRTREPDT